MTQQDHISVLHQETVDAMCLKEGDIAIDCTVGAGGHTRLMLEAVGKSGYVYGIDRDLSALALAEKNLARYLEDGRLTLTHAPFSQLATLVKNWSLFGKIQGICADVGVSSMHIDQPERGFSFMKDGPLDMRMDPTRGETAADIVNEASEEELTKIFRELGEEPKARFVARAIVERRKTAPLNTTRDLADLAKASIHYPARSKKHPATKVFQALRIKVNDELGELSQMLQDSFDALRPGGRIAIISFHSLEDRLVKTKFRDLSGKIKKVLPRGLPIAEDDTPAPASIIKPFPQSPTDEEIKNNPRARSAKLRVIEKREV